jgi:hypothetical protein
LILACELGTISEIGKNIRKAPINLNNPRENLLFVIAQDNLIEDSISHLQPYIKNNLIKICTDRDLKEAEKPFINDFKRIFLIIDKEVNKKDFIEENLIPYPECEPIGLSVIVDGPNLVIKVSNMLPVDSSLFKVLKGPCEKHQDFFSKRIEIDPGRFICKECFDEKLIHFWELGWRADN